MLLNTDTDTMGRRRIRRCIQHLISHQPFFGSLALRLPLMPGDPKKIENIASDGVALYYNPEWVAEAQFDVIARGVAHVVLAIALRHHKRMGERENERWQKASHMTTDSYLASSGFEERYKELAEYLEDESVEQVYEKLPPSQKSDKQGEQPPQPQYSGSPSPGAGEVMQPPKSDNPGEGKGDSGGQGEGDGSQGQGPSSLEGPLPEQQQALSDDQWDDALAQAAQFAKSQGDMPGAISKKLKAEHHRPMEWSEVLRRFMTSVSATDYSWLRPNHRFIDEGLYLPSRHAEGMGDIVIAIDTSGSVDDKLVSRFWSHFREICEQLNPSSVRLIQCDRRVQSDESFDPLDLPDDITIKGRGGTAFEPVFEAVAQSDVPPACLIYFTDMAVYSHPPEPDFEVLWASYARESDWRYLSKPPYGELLDLSHMLESGR